jgi:exopolyphosphatase/guanosine-5'-triphosphate,3'-diphosphate pyrophosphatase
MKLAALDLGSNSFHLLVAQIDGTRRLTKLGSYKDVLRLGSVVREQGRLNDEVFERGLASVGRAAGVARTLGAKTILAVATSALRDAANGAAFCNQCFAEHGVRVQLITGDEEAGLAYLGARSAFEDASGRVLVADIGGGSVELALGEDATCTDVRSLPLGFLRLASAFPMAETGGPTRLARYVQLECESARWQLGRFDTLLLSGGTARALGKLLGAGTASIGAKRVRELCDEVCSSSRTQLLRRGVDAARAETLGLGAAVVSGLVAGFGQRQLRISPRGLREGLILRELMRPAPTEASRLRAG